MPYYICIKGANARTRLVYSLFFISTAKWCMLWVREGWTNFRIISWICLDLCVGFRRQLWQNETFIVKFKLYVEIKRQLDATDDFYCRSYCLLNMFRAPLCPSSGASNTTGSSHLYNTLELLMMGIMVPETCWASNKICNKNHLLRLVGILFPHICELG